MTNKEYIEHNGKKKKMTVKKENQQILIKDIKIIMY